MFLCCDDSRGEEFYVSKVVLGKEPQLKLTFDSFFLIPVGRLLQETGWKRRIFQKEMEENKNVISSFPLLQSCKACGTKESLSLVVLQAKLWWKLLEE